MITPIHQAGKAGEILQAVPLPHGAAFVVQEYLSGGRIHTSVIISERGETRNIPLPERNLCTSLLYAQGNLYVLYRQGAGKSGGGTMIISPNGVKQYGLIGALGVYERGNEVRYRNKQSGQEFRLFPAPLVYIRKRGDCLLAASTHNAVLIKNGTPLALNLSRINGVDLDADGNIILLSETEDGVPVLYMGNMSRVISQAKGARGIEFVPPDRCIISTPSGVLLISREAIKKVEDIVWASHESVEFVSSAVIISSNEKERTHQVYYFPVDGKGLFDLLTWCAGNRKTG